MEAQTVFRYSATMADPVDQDALQRALDETVEDFPSFAVTLRTGFFWRYLQEADAPRVHPEDGPICAPLHTGRASVLIRVTYYHDRINFEISHMVSDGRGALAFFKALLGAYVGERYGVTVSDDGTPTPSRSQRVEDAFDKNYEPGKGGGKMEWLPYRIPGPKLYEDPTYLEFHLPVKPVIDLAHQWGVSLTSVVITAMLLSVRQGMARRDVGKRVLRVGVPVDLRDAFGSQTTRNFFGMVYLSLPTTQAIPHPKDFAREVQRALTREVLPDNVKRRMNTMIRLEKNPFLRLSPVFMKDVVLRLADQEKRTVTTTVSNLGVVRLPPEVAAHVRNVNIITTTVGLNMCLCSFGDDLSIGLSTVYVDPNVIEGFVRFFSGLGICGYINSSRAKTLPVSPVAKDNDKDGEKDGAGTEAEAKAPADEPAPDPQTLEAEAAQLSPTDDRAPAMVETPIATADADAEKVAEAEADGAGATVAPTAGTPSTTPDAAAAETDAPGKESSHAEL